MIIEVDDCVGCDVCYSCGRKHVHVRICDKCKDPLNDFVYYANDKGEFCEDCFFEDNDDYNETLTLENVQKVGEESPEEVQINQFLVSVYSDEDINEILLKDFKKMPVSMQNDYIRRYIEDIDCPADWAARMAQLGDEAAKRIVESEVRNG